jgi:serine/threonine protein kinase
VPGIDLTKHLVRFAGFELDTRTGELRQDGANVIRLSEQPLRIMIALLERPGELVLREDLRKRLWPNDTVVEFEHSINAAMKRLRQTLGDSAENPRFIETLARRGYRWKTPVEWVEAATEDHSPPAASAKQNLIGKRVAHYRVLEVLGGGGMGVVYKAEDLKLGRRVALKFLPEELAADPNALERFRREARAASAADHPNICTIYEVGEHEGAPFIAMQLLQGQTLRERIETGGGAPIHLQELLVTAIQVADGLSAAHREGIIHRDIKPANVFVTSQGQAKILDFGLAKLVMGGAVGGVELEHDPNGKDGAHGMPGETVRQSTTVPFHSQTGVAMGTAGYMSPEQVRGQKLDARTDLFSFGVVLYEMATGKQAFMGSTGPELQDAILTQMPRPARELNPRVPAALERIISKALQKERDARYLGAVGMRADLETLKREIEPRHRIRQWTVAAVCLVVVLGSTAFWFAKRRPYWVASPDLKWRQLTNNSSENHVISGGISPDGKYLAYTDTKGLHIKLLETGEIRDVPLPEGIKNQKIEFECAAWFPDGTRFLANSHPVETDPQYWHDSDASIWVVSVLGGAPRLLRDSAWAWSFSPDGSLIALEQIRGGLALAKSG